MKQKLYKLFKQKIEITIVIRDIYDNIEINEEKMNEINKELKTIRRAIRN